MDRQPTTVDPRSRPLTVVLLAAWLAIGVVWVALIDSAISVGDIVALAAAALLAHGVWHGHLWAFVWLFCSAILCTIPLVVYFVAERDAVQGIPVALLLAGLFVLLLHPATKHYARADRMQRPSPLGNGDRPSAPARAEPVGMRRNTVIALAMLLVAITIAGVLGVMRAWQLGT